MNLKLAHLMHVMRKNYLLVTHFYNSFCLQHNDENFECRIDTQKQFALLFGVLLRNSKFIVAFNLLFISKLLIMF